MGKEEKNNKIYISTFAKLLDVQSSECDGILKAYEGLKQKPLEAQRDLMKMSAILLSTGMNNNDDVFLKEEVLPVRNTGANKPLNMEHDSGKIIGHMTKTYVTLKNGKVVPDDSENVPEDFDITAEAFIYKFMFPELAKAIKQNALDNKLFVSVEVWFKDYDYLVGDIIVKRTNATSELDEILRINGGSGKYKGKTVGRVLRSMLIGGIGIVKHPANPESVIKSVSNLESLDVSSIDKGIKENIIGRLNTNASLKEDSDMSKEKQENSLHEEQKAIADFHNDKQNKELKAQADLLIEQSKEIQKHKYIVEEQSEVIALLKANETQLIATATDTTAKNEEEIRTKEEELAIALAKVAEYEKEKEAVRRKLSLSEIGFDESAVDELIEKYSKLTAEEFDQRKSELEFIKEHIQLQTQANEKEDNNESSGGDKEADEAQKDEAVDDSANAEDDSVPDLENGKQVDAPLDNKSDKVSTPSLADKMLAVINKMKP